jgi:hypothetical protein
MTAPHANTATLHSDRPTPAGTLAVIHSRRAPTAAKTARERVPNELVIGHPDHEPKHSRPRALR